MKMVEPAPVPRGQRAFGALRRKSDGSVRTHNGVDLFAPLGTPVRATAPGRVAMVATEWRPRFSGYGRFVVVDLDSGGQLLVAHLDRVSVSPGARVEPGMLLGTVGTTYFGRGDKTGHFKTSKPHVHVEYLKGRRYPVAPTVARVDPGWLAFPVGPIDPKFPPPSEGGSCC